MSFWRDFGRVAVSDPITPTIMALAAAATAVIFNVSLGVWLTLGVLAGYSLSGST
jgi:hypothetical protein